jgi:hypothetical protein
MAIQLVRGHERFSIEQEFELGLPGASAAYDHVGVTITRGGRPKRTRYTSLEAAAHKFHGAILEQLDDGFVLEVEGVSTSSTEPVTFTSLPPLEQRVDDHPDVLEHLLALADAWCAVADPRGECIQHERTLVGQANVDEYLRHKKKVEASRRIRFKHVWGALGREGYRVRATFANGLVERLTLEDETAAPGRSTNELLAIALASPYARFLRRVDVLNGNEDDVAQLLANHPRSRQIEIVCD